MYSDSDLEGMDALGVGTGMSGWLGQVHAWVPASGWRSEETAPPRPVRGERARWDTGGMHYLIAEEAPADEELVELYESVGWSAYTSDPAKLAAAVGASFLVLTARDEQGALVGLIRTVSDGLTIAYVQDILIAPSHQRQGIGGQLLDELLERTASVRQVVLTTDSEEKRRAFYESRGFVEVHDVQPHQLRSFVRLR